MTGLLLDTNVLIWYLERNDRLGASVCKEIEKAEHVFISTISIWEIAIKRLLGKLKTPDNLLELIAAKNFRELKPSFADGLRTGTLPPVHGDPFDRMLVAQALGEGLALVTGDRHIPHYDVKVITV